MAQAAALGLALVAAWLAERAQSGEHTRSQAEDGRSWFRPRGRSARERASGEDAVPATGWAHETLSHSLRAERTRAALPQVWPLVLGLTRWALLLVFVLPAAALWVSAWASAWIPVAPVPLPGESADSVTTAVFLVAATIAGVALLLARWRRNLGTFALLLCSALSVATYVVALLHDALGRWPSTNDLYGLDYAATTTPESVEQWYEGAPWLSHQLFEAGTRIASDGVGLNAVDAGYLLGAALVCATALVMGQQMARRALFDRPPLEIRHVHPLSMPLPQDVRARLHWAFYSVPVAVLLALRPVADRPGVAWMLALAGAICLCGWRFKVLGPRQFASALGYASLAGIALWLAWFASGGANENALRTRVVQTKNSKIAPLSRDARIAAIPATSGATTLSGGLIPGGTSQPDDATTSDDATGTGTIGKAARRDSPAAKAVSALKQLREQPVWWLIRARQHALFLGGALVLLALVLWLLKRPPAHLWSILSLAPAWGWMLLGGTSVLVVAPLLLAQGQDISIALGMALLPAFFFVWLERA